MNTIGIDMPEVVSTQTNPQETLSNETAAILLDGNEDVEKGAKMTDKNSNENNTTANDLNSNSNANANANSNINKDSNNATDKQISQKMLSITDDNDETKKNEKQKPDAAVEEKIESTNSGLEESPEIAATAAAVALAAAAAAASCGHKKDNEHPTNAVNNHIQLEDEQEDTSPTESSPSDDKVKESSSLQQPALQKENGTMENCDGAVVDLGDDTDDEEETCKSEITISKIIPNAVEHNNRKAALNNVPTDTAVVIASDSENEEVSFKKQEEEAKKTEITDDDDDDCVVIEDSTSISSDLNKRKSVSVDESIGDDNQPPMKRIRSNMDSNMIRQDNSLLKKNADNASVYPVTITPATNVASQGPPKMMAVPNVPNNIGMGLSAGQNNNSSLLPGLTDDMFVLEAPSFIVPYIYEKPPAVTLTNIIKDIETLFSLSKEDLAEADKTDEFDMITEQNKSDKVDSESKKKKKRWTGDDGDDSWSEQSEEEEDDDEDSESGVRTKVLIKEASDDLSAFKGAIKPAAVVSQVTANTTPGAPGAVVAKPGQENYFESPLGKFFMDIGVGLVQEFVQSDLIRLQKRKMRKSLGKNTMEFERAIAALSGNLEASKKKNSPYKFTMKRCEFCNFKSESALAMANHYETPHMNGALYKCNFCNFEIRNATEIVYHMEAVHNIKARLIKPLPYHQCPNCGFEDNGKAKLARHQPVCAKKFRPELNLAPPNDWEAPAKIPRIKPRHGLVGTATAYQAMAAQAAAQKAALASIQQQQQAAARSLQAATMAAQNAANKMRGRAPIVQRQIQNPGGMIRPSNTIRTPNMASNLVISNSYQLTNNQLLQASNTMNKKPLSGQPSISITPLPRQSNAPPSTSMPSTSSKVPQAGAKPGQSPGGSKAQFVICEICDGYIKDLEQLRNHMQWMHKVKIHPKMIYNRPPLNCQKCQFRFFTDQGLERHLLGSHGLVTSSMQEAANKGKDSGRCPVCGRMYQWKLLNHVSRDHHMTLKPAHLSYKCTVCTATFGMYKQFETHVYTAHSTVAKRAMDGKKSNTPGPSSSNSGGQRPTTANDSILKPLKINDEITIIPQPATKPRITNMESHVID